MVAKSTYYDTKRDNFLVGFDKILPNDFEKCSKMLVHNIFQEYIEILNLFLAKIW